MPWKVCLYTPTSPITPHLPSPPRPCILYYTVCCAYTLVQYIHVHLYSTYINTSHSKHGRSCRSSSTGTEQTATLQVLPTLIQTVTTRDLQADRVSPYRLPQAIPSQPPSLPPCTPEHTRPGAFSAPCT